ncbi:site-specific integrase [Microbacterium sp. SORGH_AS_0888]|uniref:site-specific integrase n=1 Tax=Microbacterium sp. SORGH_AS_0888 TaxID=3041791 RepID=UPI00278421DB|nr:site-specific integrase [Microbacterium sp. SORGH_AS_0888]MDQ1128276.1 integrase [Microbacterium sp. SORGH_AS_0888]
MARDGIGRRCYCRDDEGKALGSRCTKLGGSRHGVWEFRVSAGSDPATGKRRMVKRSGFATKAEAEAARDEVVRKLRRGVLRFEVPTLAEHMTTWLARAERTEELKATTLREYRRYADDYVVPELGAMKLDTIRRAHVAQWVDHMAEAGRGSVAIRRAHATLRSGLAAAVQLDLIETNPAASVKLPKVTTRRVEPWTLEEAGRFLDTAAQHRLGALFELAVMTGMRRGELVGLRWRDVRLGGDAPQLVVRQQLVRVGDKVLEQTVKTDAGQDRTVPLTDRAVGALLAWQLRQAQERDAAVAAGIEVTGDRVFTMADGSDCFPEYPSRVLGPLVKQAGLRPQRLHDLRHLFASLMLASGEDLTVVSKVMGHSNSQITRDLYAHLVGDRARTAVMGGLALLPPSARTGVPATVPAGA